jgi:hypothetical protein
MSDVYVHQVPCPRCAGELVFHACEPCAAPFLHCAACAPKRGGSRCARCKAPSSRHATLDELVAVGEHANAHARGVRVEREDAVTMPEGEVRSALWYTYFVVVAMWCGFGLEAGADLRLLRWILWPTVAVLLATGWVAWRHVRGDRVFWAQALGAGTAATAALMLAVWLGENGNEGLTRLHRWWAFFTLGAAWTAGFARRPDALPATFQGLLLELRRANRS